MEMIHTLVELSYGLLLLARAWKLVQPAEPAKLMRPGTPRAKPRRLAAQRRPAEPRAASKTHRQRTGPRSPARGKRRA